MWLKVWNIISKSIKIKTALANRGLSEENEWNFFVQAERIFEFSFSWFNRLRRSRAVYIPCIQFGAVCYLSLPKAQMFSFLCVESWHSMLWVEGKFDVWTICVIFVYVFRVFLIFLLPYIWWKIDMRKKKFQEFKARKAEASIRKSRINFPHSAWLSFFLPCFQCANVFPLSFISIQYYHFCHKKRAAR